MDIQQLGNDWYIATCKVNDAIATGQAATHMGAIKACIVDMEVIYKLQNKQA